MTLGFAPLSAGPTGSVPAPFSSSGAPQVEADAPTLVATMAIGSVTVNVFGAVTVVGVAAQGSVGAVGSGAATVGGTALVSGVSAAGAVGMPIVQGGTVAVLVGLQAIGYVGIQSFPYTPPAAPDVVLAGLVGTFGVIAEPTVQAWEFDAASAQTDLWAPVPPVTGTAQPQI